MSLDRVMKKLGVTGTTTIKNVEIFFPPEYGFTSEQWKQAVQAYAPVESDTVDVSISSPILQYLRQLAPTRSDWKSAVTIKNFFWLDGRLFVDLQFEKDRGGLTALVVYRAENLKIVPIVPEFKTNQLIHRFSLTYVVET